RRTVARPLALDLAGVHRGAVEVGADEIVDRLVGVGDVAAHLWLGDALRSEAERPRLGGAGLLLAPGEGNRPAVQPACRPGLEAGELEAAPREAVADRLAGAVAGAAAARLRFAGVHHGLEERARRQHDRLRPVQCLAARHNAEDAPRRAVFEQQR